MIDNAPPEDNVELARRLPPLVSVMVPPVVTELGNTMSCPATMSRLPDTLSAVFAWIEPFCDNRLRFWALLPVVIVPITINAITKFR